MLNQKLTLIMCYISKVKLPPQRERLMYRGKKSLEKNPHTPQNIPQVLISNKRIVFLRK